MSQSQNPEQDDTNDIDTTDVANLEQQPAISQQKSHTKPKAKLNDQAKPKGNGIAWFALLLALTAMAGVGAGGYYWYQNQSAKLAAQQQWQVTQANQLQQLETKLNQQLATSKAQIDQQQKSVNQAISASINDNMLAFEQKLNHISGRQPTDWQLAEANYLIRMAGRKLWLEDDINTSLHLLANADITISGLNDPSLLPIRTAIANDIALIRGLANPQVEDIHLTLSGLIGQVDVLTINLAEQSTVVAKLDEPQQVSGQIDDWQQNLMHSVGGMLSKMFHVEAGIAQGDIAPMKMPRQQWFLRANLSMAWLQAQVALLKREQKVFQDSIAQSIKWLSYFNQNDLNVQASITALQTMVNLPIRAQYPESFSSQKLLKQTLQQRLSTIPTAPALPSEPAQSEPAPQNHQIQPIHPVPAKTESEQGESL